MKNFSLWVGAFAVLSILDMVFSLYAFSKGVGEANPVMLFANDVGAFIPIKLAFTGIVVGLFYWCRGHRLTPFILKACVGVFTLLLVVHIYGALVIIPKIESIEESRVMYMTVL